MPPAFLASTKLTASADQSQPWCLLQKKWSTGVLRPQGPVSSRYKLIAQIKVTRHILHDVVDADISPCVAYVTHMLAKEIGDARKGLLSNGHCCTLPLAERLPKGEYAISAAARVAGQPRFLLSKPYTRPGRLMP
jgi:hypothetical protein